jgi:D-3-phosphoglycerate dehydrogenase
MEAQENIGLEVAEKLGKYSDIGTTTSAVNFPEVALPAHPDLHRILHIHKNVPGIMNSINSILAENNINICSQFLQTFGDVGYVVIDVNAAGSEVALDKIQTVEGTIKVRRLF